MKVTDQIRFFFADWKKSNLSALVLLILALSIFIGFSLNVPAGKVQSFTGIVESIDMTHSSKYSASYSTARVTLDNGKKIVVTLPRSVNPKVGASIPIKYERNLISGGFYRYGGDNP